MNAIGFAYSRVISSAVLSMSYMFLHGILGHGRGRVKFSLPLTSHDLKQITLSHGLLVGKWARALPTSEKVL